MSLQNVQDQVDKWIKTYTSGYWKPLEMIARLTEETGELAREINHVHGPKKKKDTEDIKEIAEEIADIIFTVSCLANSLSINLDDAFKKVMDKYNERDSKRWK
ncbi:MAG: nucleotide pyrophosphohydrolase [Candidatus Aenigmatarchaeota archaeon]